MKLRKIVSEKNREVIDSQETLQQAAKRMAASGIGTLAVVDDGRIAGTLTDRDIRIGAVAAGLRPDQATVSNAMTSKVVRTLRSA